MILDKINYQYKKIVNALMDEESKKIFESRVEFMITRDEDKLEKHCLIKKKNITVWKLIQ